MKKKILLQAFLAEVADDLIAARFYGNLSEEQQREVVDYVSKSFDEREMLSRSATALHRLKEGRIDFV